MSRLAINEAIQQRNLRAATESRKTGTTPKLETAVTHDPKREQAGTTYRKEKVVVAREAEIGGGLEGKANKFSIQTETESALIDTVEDFVHHLDNPVLTATLDPWQRNFIAEFKKQFGGEAGDGASYDPAQLHEYASQYVRRTDGSGLVGALKIAEWKVAMYQKATGANIAEKQGHIVTHRPDMRSAGITPTVETQEQKVKRKLLGFIPFGEKTVVGSTPTAQKKEGEQKAARSAPVPERDANYYYDVEYPAATGNAITYNPNTLSGGQIAYLRSVGIDIDPGSAGPPVVPARSVTLADGAGTGDRYASAEKNKVRDILDRLTSARVVTYEALGKMNVELNLVRAGAYIAEPQRFLQIEHKAGTTAPANAEAAIVKQLEAATEDMKKQNKETAKKAQESAKEAKKQSEDSRLVRLISDKKAELSQDQPPPSEDDAKKIKANEEKIAEDQTRKTELEQVIVDGKKLEGLQKDLDERRTKLGANFALVETLNKPVDAGGNPEPGSVLESEEQYTEAQEATVAAKERLDQARQIQTEADKNLALQKPNANADLLARLKKISEDAHTDYDIKQLTQEYDDARTAEATAKKEHDRRTRLQAKHQREWDAYNNAQEALDAAVKAYKEAAQKQGVTGTLGTTIYGIANLDISEADLKAAIDAAETEIKQLTTENEKTKDPNKLNREHQKGVYEELEATITPPDKITEIENRASEIKNKKKEQYLVPEAYKDYPEVYIQTLRVIFGDSITDFQNAEEFKKATALISPEVFFTYMDQKLFTSPPPVTGAFDGALRDPSKMKKLSSKMLHDFVADVMEAGAQGGLGALDQATVIAIEDMQQRIPDPNIFTAVQADRIALTQQISHDIYHFENIDDLAQRIWRQAQAGVVFAVNSATITTEEEAKAYAQEVVRLRNI
jgi:hypothetical protein